MSARHRLVLAVIVPVLSFAFGGRSLADGTASEGSRTLRVSQATGLAAEGQSVVVEGSGYDTSKGIYVALCVRTAKGVMPSPCGGGADLDGGAGASIWISDNPPEYAKGLTIPYGPGGSFRVTFRAGPTINSAIDCRAVQCAIVTRADHTILSDRSQDLQIPVTFLGSPATVTTTTVRATTTTVAPGTSAVPDDTVVESVTTIAEPIEPSGTSVPEQPVDDVSVVTVVGDLDELIAVAEGADSGGVPAALVVGIVAVVLAGAAGAVYLFGRRR
jgi:hypothetical protein